MGRKIMRAHEFLESIILEKGLAKVDLAGSIKRGDVARKAPRLHMFLNKIINGENFLTTDGKHVKIRPEADVLDKIKVGNIPNDLPLYPEGTIKLSKLEKTPEFGGEDAEKRLAAERKAMTELGKLIEIVKEDRPYILLNVGGKIVHAATVANTPGTPKSDFEIYDENGKSVAWISHKDGSPANPKKFGQWAGVSHYISHPEVSDFVETIRKRFPEGMPKGTTAIHRQIVDNDLKMKAVYGSNVGSDIFGIHNVNTVLQGPMSIKQEGDHYILTALKEFINGSELPYEYTPILIARYTSDRNDQQIPHTRMSIYPLFGRKVQEE
jgi:hypothetical protein